MTGLPEASALPERLREREQWLCWRADVRDGKPTKVPLVPGTDAFASATDPDDWDRFEAARDAVASTSADGVGFAFTADGPLVGVDLDDCRDPETGELDDTAREIVRRLDSYTEVSPSGTGVHVLVRGELPDGRNRSGSIECYDRARYFTVTGDVLTELPDRIAERSEALAEIHDDYLAASTQSTDADSLAPSESTTSLDDDEVVERAKAAANGRKFRRLWNGRTSGYPSHSEADMALCCLLAFWTQGDHTQMDRLFRQSGLVRPKWEEVHYADGATYGERTIERAIDTTDEYYEPSTESHEPETGEGTSSTTTDDAPAGRSAIQLAEENELLLNRVERLETELQSRADRIAELEDQVADDGEDPPTRDEPASEPADDGSDLLAAADASTTSVVGRVWRWLGRA